MQILDRATTDRLQAASLTYPDAGSYSGPVPAGYAPFRRALSLGPVPLESAAAALFDWQVHEGAGLAVRASGPVAPDAVVVLGVGVGPVRVHAPCRVVAVLAEGARVGFVYGTLPGHPESGEESFVLQQHQDGSVTFTISAFSRPAAVSTRLAGPVGRAVQRTITERYLRAMGRLVRAAAT